MTSLFQKLLLIFASATHRELVRQIQYLKVENEILRGKPPKRITVTPIERRRLVKFAVKLGKALRHLVTIVAASTLLRWIREDKWGRRTNAKRGRRRKPEEIRRLVIKLARENSWGYTRILGELKKLGIRSLSKNTVKRILRENTLEPGPRRGAGTWDEFLKRQAASLWQCDFFEQRIFTMQGIRSAFVLVFLHLKSRQVVISPATLHPNDTWVVEQAANFVNEARSRGLRVRHVQHDRDTKFTRSFDSTLKRHHVRSRRIGFCSPNLNAFVERFIQSIRQECLDHFVVLGTTHLDHLCREYAAHYHEERPHQSLDNEPIVGPKFRGRRRQVELLPQIREIGCHQRLGGLLKSYWRKVA